MADVKTRYNAMIENLRRHNFRLTPQRLAVAKILANSEGHPNVVMIHDQLRLRFPTMSLATVYRNVLLFKSLGEVLELGFTDGSNRYDGNKPHPHPHVICTQCKKIIDPDLEAFDTLTEEVARRTGFKIDTHRIDFFGICGDCRRQTKKIDQDQKGRQPGFRRSLSKKRL